MEDLPSKKITVKAKNLNDIEELSLLRVDLQHILISPESKMYALLEGDDKDVAIILNAYEGSMLSFFFKSLHKNSHIHTIYQIFNKHLKDNNSSIEKVVLESKVGDILYCTLHYIDSKHRRYYSVCSIVDGLIMSILNKLNFYVVKETWDKIDPYDDWNYEEFIVDWTRE
jgi:hypothetical protein